MTEQNRLFNDEDMLFRRDRRDRPEAWSDVSKRGMVAAAHYRATEAGARMLAMGGNAVDAAVASALALGVCEPAGSGLGGMTAMVIHLGPAGRTFVLEGSCRAPLQATPEALARCPRRRGYRAVAVPTTPAVLQYALQKYGALKAEQVLAPAIALAEEGYAVTPLQSDLARRYRKSLARENAASLFLDGRLKPFPPGSRFRQPALARTLRRLAKAGFEDFYTGQIARQICRDMSQNGGFIQAQDLANIPWPAEKNPSAVQFGNWRICTMGPPGGGLALLQMLRLFAASSSGEFDPD
ncbi:MAG: gamma-glutamyltransferase, partial [Elusimicrobia bacterium]|nr:gamma-glutamyltransferase [Elusimicrobiota bacterium]